MQRVSKFLLFFSLILFGLLSFGSKSISGTSSTQITTGWNLVGNGSTVSLPVATTFGSVHVTSVWKWNADSSTWSFYSPSLSDGGVAYAVTKGYKSLTTINPGDGFWINASQPFELPAFTGDTYYSSNYQQGASGQMLQGWNLISVGDTITPNQFNAALTSTSTGVGVTPQSLTSLWAWDSIRSNWFFYAPSLEEQGNNALANYISAKGYLDFSKNNKTLGQGVGFWVNNPNTPTATTSTTAKTSTTSQVTTSTTVVQSTTTTTLPKQTQTITFAQLSAQAVGATTSLLATASSGLAVSFATSTAGVCSVTGSTLTPIATGTCTIVASQSGNEIYSAASNITQSFAVETVSSPKVEASTLNGTVATGAPVVNAIVSVVDSRGNTVGSGTSDSTGAYTIAFSTPPSPPLVIKASGIIGDSTANLYSISETVGTANVSQVTSAITATLSASGNPADIFNNSSSLNLSTQQIKAVDAAYSRAFSNLTTSTTSFITSAFNSTIDTALDNIKVEIKPSGAILLATTSNLASNDLSAGQSSSTPLTTVTIPKGQSPSEASATQLLSTTPSLSIADLENLRAKLQNCFSTPSTSRGTPTNPIAACADSNFVVSSDPSASNGFRHSGFRWNNANWNNPNFNQNSANTAYHYGIFGYALTNSTMDGATFLKPRIIRPLDQQGNSWIVLFPIQLNTGVLSSLGDSTGSKFLVVKKIPSLVSANDNGYRFVGDQRDYSAIITPAIQKMSRQSGADYQTGFNLIFKKLSSTDSSNRKAVLANIKGKGLPPGGIYLAQNDSSCGTNVNSTLAISFLNNVSYNGSTMSEALLASNTNNGSPNWSGIQTTDICTATLRLSETASEAGAIALRSWGADGTSIGTENNSFTYQGTTTASGNWLSDSDLSMIGYGEPYNIKLWLSDGSTVNYVNRLPTSMLSLTEATSYPDFPDFTTSTKSAFSTFAGTSNFSASVKANSNIYINQVGMFWNGSATSSTNFLSPTATSTSLSCAANCNSGNWMPGMAMLKAFARTVDSLSVSTIYWNY